MSGSGYSRTRHVSGATWWTATMRPCAKYACSAPKSRCTRAGCAGAPMVGWAMYPAGAFGITRGTPKVYASSTHGRRYFCPDCGTGLYYVNEALLPGIVDVQSATLDDPGAMPPRVHIQVAERLPWMTTAHELPSFDRFPPGK